MAADGHLGMTALSRVTLALAGLSCCSCCRPTALASTIPVCRMVDLSLRLDEREREKRERLFRHKNKILQYNTLIQ